MANNVESNFREKVMPIFLKAFDSNRVYSKTVDTQLLSGVFDASSGESVAYKRDTDYLAIETTDGDLTGEDPSPIVVGNGFARVQDRITVLVEYQRIEQALPHLEHSPSPRSSTPATVSPGTCMTLLRSLNKAKPWVTRFGEGSVWARTEPMGALPFDIRQEAV